MWVTEIAEELQVSHSAISQLVSTLEKKKLIKFLQDRSDRRRRLICLTKKGLALVEEVKPVWKSISKNMQNLLEEGPNSEYLFHALDEAEDSMDRQSLCSRVMTDLESSQLLDLNIVPYDSNYKTPFKKLMLSWLLDNYNAEVLNVDLINNPEQEIIGNDGLILLVKIQDEIVGTIVAKIKGRLRSDILYLVVDEHWRKRKIGKKLLAEVMKQLELRGVRDIRIELDRKLTPAIRLFESAGFQLKERENGRSLIGVKSTNLLIGTTL